VPAAPARPRYYHASHLEGFAELELPEEQACTAAARAFLLPTLFGAATGLDAPKHEQPTAHRERKLERAGFARTEELACSTHCWSEACALLVT
jgi:hypothetical protein